MEKEYDLFGTFSVKTANDKRCFTIPCAFSDFESASAPKRQESP